MTPQFNSFGSEELSVVSEYPYLNFNHILLRGHYLIVLPRTPESSLYVTLMIVEGTGKGDEET